MNTQLSNKPLTASLKEYFGFDHFRPGQAEVIEHLLAGRSAAAVFPTGSGKSLCYQLPALLLDGLTLVVSPLIALMKDQVDALSQRGIRAARMDSTLSADEYRSVMQDLRSGDLRILYVAPERLSNERFRETIGQSRVALLAVDEAHCISEWGHNFRPDYLKLAGFAKDRQVERVLALTATATDAVLRDICRSFQIEEQTAVRTGFYRPNLTLSFQPVQEATRDQTLLAALRSRPLGPTIVYVTLQKTAESVAERLAAEGLPARAYHAGMKDEERAAVQDWFMQHGEAIVVATIAFGMGIDKANIRYVYHYNMPKSLENYSQEIGRAGRDGLPSVCELFPCAADLNVLENFARGDTPTLAAVRSLLRDVFSQPEQFAISHYDLSSRHDIRLIVVRTLLTYLELQGYIQSGTAFFESYQFQPKLSSAEILKRFTGERRSFVADILRQAVKAKTWFNLDIDRASAKLKQPRERIVRALDYLGEQKLLELKVSGVRNSYRRLKSPPDIDALADELYQRAVLREEKDIERIHQVLEIASAQQCQVSKLGEYFGEPLTEPCGHCSWCLSQSDPSNAIPPALVERPGVEIDPALWSRFLALRKKQGNLLADPRMCARFLCGLTSPHLTRSRLTRDDLFGALAHVPFGQVMEHAAEQTEPSTASF